MRRGTLDTWWRAARDRRSLVLGSAALVQVSFLVTPHLVRRPAWAVAAAALFALSCVLAVLGRLRGAFTLQLAAPFVLLLVVACWQLAMRDAVDSLGVLALLAVIWLALYGTRNQAWLAVAGVAVALLGAPLLSGGGLSGADWRVGILALMAAVLIGPTLNYRAKRGEQLRAAARDLDAQREIYRLLVEQLPLTTVALFDEDLRCLTIGGHWLTRSGLSPAEFVGRRAHEFFLEPDRAKAREFYERALSAPAEADMDLSDGRCYEFTAMPVAGPRGEHLVLSLARDMTDRRQAEIERQEMVAALAVSEGSFREAFEGAPIGMALTTLSGAPDERFLRVNPAFAAILGRRPEDLVGVPVAEVTHPEDVLLQPDLSDPTASPRLQKRFVRPSGRAVWVEVSYAVVRDKDGVPSHVVKQIQDINAMKESERALLDALEQQRAATARLREVDRIRTDLVGTISHELRTPLTSIHGYLELLGDEPLTSPQLAMLNVAQRNAQRLSRLVDNLLVLVRLDSIESATLLSSADIPIASAVSAAVDTVRPEVTERQLDLQVRLPDEPAVVRGDAEQLDRVLVNLLSNATKYTPVGGRIGVDVQLRSGTVSITVSDTGIGIPLDEQEHLFTRFFRASTARAKSISGTGLGLAIVKSIVERHDGAVTVESTPGSGSRFTITLPLAACTSAASA